MAISTSDSGARRISSWGAFVTFFKSLFGAGLLALPNVMGRVGLPLGLLLYSLVAAGCSMSCHILLRARDIAKRCIEEEESAAYHPSGEHFDTHDRRRFSNESEEDAAGCGGRSRRAAGKHLGDCIRDGSGGGVSGVRRTCRHLVTYGDLADAVLGPRMASITRWTIIALNVLFTAGLVIVICENTGPSLGWEDELAARRAVALALFPLVVAMLQIPWLQDMCIISALGLVVYSAGVIGSTVYSAIGTIREAGADDGSDTFGRGVPEDLWELKWGGVPAFVGSAVYALEGISLAMPTAHSMRRPSDADCVVTGSVLLYGFVTVTFAVIGYAGGLGGGPGTGLSAEECDVVTNCITPPVLRRSIQDALSVSMLLGIPVMLYPATEMLEVMLTDREAESKEVVPSSSAGLVMVEIGTIGERRMGNTVTRPDSKTNLMCAIEEASPNQAWTHHAAYGAHETDYVQHSDDAFADDRSSNNLQHDVTKPANDGSGRFSQQKSWKLRVFLAFLVVFLGVAGARSFTLFSGLVGAVGLTFAGFVLPVLLYVQATRRAGLEIGVPMKVFLALLAGFGVVNMMVGGIASFVALIQGLSIDEV